ncbi:hypothetical protein KKF84_09195 [Myxococcota bacterium]|nr:hypothetical protein [Myxococcota bacterium]
MCVFYTACKVLIEKCSECGQAIPLDAIEPQVSCNGCGHVHALAPGLWRAVTMRSQSPTFLEAPLTAEGLDAPSAALRYSFNGMQVSARYCKVQPRCDACSALLEMDDETHADAPFTISCHSCGVESNFVPAPDWLRDITLNISHIRGGEPDTIGAARVLAVNGEEARPVSLSCPGCGSNLSISSENKRITACEYCHNEFYLPDDVWHRLHPVRKAGAVLIRNRITKESYRSSAVGWVIGTLFVAAFFFGCIALGWALGYDASKHGKMKHLYIFGGGATVLFGAPGIYVVTKMIARAVTFFKKSRKI